MPTILDWKCGNHAAIAATALFFACPLLAVTVSDAEGLSYYSDSTAGRLLKMDESSLVRARRELCRTGLIAYQAPIYQVLSLEHPVLPAETRRRTVRDGEAVSIGELLHRAMGGAA